MSFPVSRLAPTQTGRAAWRAEEMRDPARWLVRLRDEEVEELRGAASRQVESGAELASLRPEDFPLPRLSRRLRPWLERLLDGEAFLVLRGLPVAEWPLELSAAAFFGLGTHLGRPRPQNTEGHVLGHVIDQGLSSHDPSVRIYQTHERQSFHTDSCDLVGLLCLRTARSGGESGLVSSHAIYNAMLDSAPRLAAALFEPIATDRRGELAEGERPYFEIPVFNWHAGRLSSVYQRQYIDSAQRFPEATRLTPLQLEALDLHDELANDPALSLFMRLEPGDLQLVQNHDLLHDRTAFDDWPEPERRRHLLRLWLAPPEARPLPEAFAQRFGSIVPGRRGGIDLPPERWNAPLRPC